MCIAPLGKDALECLRYTDNVEKSVRNVINTSWPPGSQHKEYFDSYLTINQLKQLAEEGYNNFNPIIIIDKGIQEEDIYQSGGEIMKTFKLKGTKYYQYCKIETLFFH